MSVRRRHVLRFRDGWPEVRDRRGPWVRLKDPARIRIEHVGSAVFVVGSRTTSPGTFNGLCRHVATALLNEAAYVLAVPATSSPRAAVINEVIDAVASWVASRLRWRWPDDFWVVLDVMRN